MESVHSEADREFGDLLTTLRVRFEQHPERHLDASWDDVRLRLAAAAGAANALRQDVAMITPADIEPLRAEVGLRRLD